MTDWRRAAPFLACAAVALLGAVLLEVLLALPGVPYNVRELRTTTMPVLGTLGLSAFGLAAAVVAPWVAVRIVETARGLRPLLTALVGHTLLLALLALSVFPEEALHDVAGSPILKWPWHFELLWRLSGVFALFSATSIAAWTAVLSLGRWPTGPAAAGVVFLAGVLYSYWTVVIQACTDNLTELLAGGGTLSSYSAIGGGLLALGLASAAVGRLVAPGPLARLAALGLSIVAAGVAGSLVSAGLAARIDKYGATFSALQFLLSPGRDSYLPQDRLHMRFGILIVAMVAGFGVAGGLVVRAVARRRAAGVEDADRTSG
jgi:hypothetical protein